MLVLEATSNRQGERSGDYHWCNDGELAYRSVIDCARPDCGCERGWVGVESSASTTTVQVVERPTLTIDQLASMLAISLCDDGDGYLVAISVDGYELGIASFFVKHEGYIDSFFAIPDSISTYTQLMKTLQRSAFKPFRKLAPSSVLRALNSARDVPVELQVVLPGAAWPKNQPLLDFIADKVTW